MRIHHDKHHQAYVDNANKALAGTAFADTPVEDILKSLDQVPDDKRTAVRNNAGGHANHTLFWQVVQGMGGDLAAAIDSTFSGLDALKDKVGQAAITRFGAAGPAWNAPASRCVSTSTRTARCRRARRRSSGSTSGSTPTT